MRYISLLFLLFSCTKEVEVTHLPDVSLKTYLTNSTIRTQYIEHITDSTFSVQVPMYRDSFKFTDLTDSFQFNYNGYNRSGFLNHDTLFFKVGSLNYKYFFRTNERYTYCNYPYGLFYSWSRYENNYWFINTKNRL